MLTPRTDRVSFGRRINKYLLSFKYMFRKNKPSLPFRVLYNYLYYLIKRTPRLRYVDLAVTYKCDLSCIHCSASRLLDPSRKELTIEDYANIGDQLFENGVLVVQLTGGEPLVRPDLAEIIKALKPSRFFVSMGTNCMGVTRERLETLKKAGLDNLCISVDDWEPAEHDRWRDMPGLHKKAFEAIDLAREMGFTAMVFTVATHQNLRTDAFTKLIRFTESKRILLLVGWAVPAGNWNANDDVLLTEDDLAYMETLHEQYPHVRTDFEANYFHWGCGAGKEKLYITSYGDVIPCAFVHIRFGNILQKSLKEIRENAMKIDWFREYNSLCLAANDREFQAKHLSRVRASEKEPVSMREAGFDVDE